MNPRLDAMDYERIIEDAIERGDQKTLAVLHRWYEKTRAAVNRHRERRAEEKAAQE